MASAQALERLHISVTVWGDDYTSLFLSIGVPNLCALAMELPEALRAESRVRIFTTTVGLSSIKSAHSIASLRQRIAVDIVDAVVFANYDTYGRYAPMVVAQSRAVVEASREGAAIVFMGPDLVFSKGAFALFVDRARQGFRTIVGPAPRIIRESATPVLHGKIAAHPQGVLDISANEFADFAFDHWHPVNELFMWNAPRSVHWKAHLLYRVSEGDVLMRFFQGSTFFAWPKHEIAEYRGFIDHALVTLCCDRYDQIYIVPDSSECLACDLMAQGQDEHMPQGNNRELDLLKEMLNLRKINRFNIHYGLHTCRFHRSDAVGEAWRSSARILSREVDPLLKISLPLRVIGRTIVLLYASWLGRALRSGTNFLLRAFAWLSAPLLSRPP
jgi:hypothetical protein